MNSYEPPMLASFKVHNTYYSVEFRNINFQFTAEMAPTGSDSIAYKFHFLVRKRETEVNL